MQNIIPNLACVNCRFGRNNCGRMSFTKRQAKAFFRNGLNFKYRMLRYNSTINRLFLLFTLTFFATNLHAQAPKKPNAAEILQGLKKLNVVGSALYIAAHPDDENTALIAWLANEKLVKTGYL